MFDAPAARARERGWPVRRIPAGHFHMLVDPAIVAAALIDMARLLTAA